MARTSNKFIGALAAALVIAALVPTASPAYQDLRSPDARDAGRPSPDRSPSPDATGGSTSADRNGLGVAVAILVLIAVGGVALFWWRSDRVPTFRSRARHIT